MGLDTKEVKQIFEMDRMICSKIIREECCYKCHDGVCETCNVGRVLKRLKSREELTRWKV